MVDFNVGDTVQLKGGEVVFVNSKAEFDTLAVGEYPYKGEKRYVTFPFNEVVSIVRERTFDLPAEWELESEDSNV